MLTKLLSINEVNNLISEHFIKIFGNVVEHFPAAAIGILKNRPFSNPKDISQAINNYLDTLKLNEKEKILQIHPDIVNKLSDLSKLILELEINKINIEEKMKLKNLNNQYKTKFGFPFVICEKENNLEQIFSEMESRVENEKEDEIKLAIEEVKKISYFKIFEIVR